MLLEGSYDGSIVKDARSRHYMTVIRPSHRAEVLQGHLGANILLVVSVTQYMRYGE